MAVSVSAYALIDQHEPPVTLAIGLLVAVVIGLLIGRSGSGRVSRPEHTLTAYTIQSVVRVVAVSTVYVLLANALGSTGASGAFAAVLVGTLAERVVTFRRALGLDA